MRWTKTIFLVLAAVMESIGESAPFWIVFVLNVPTLRPQRRCQTTKRGVLRTAHYLPVTKVAIGTLCRASN
ncbi:hypothetical protein LCGC14_1113670 [marine sediment metagenome]|uniref:Uncharacterized protein n=1 Tax=marine sediment metagenome TaxID=412755 RepID=A0A0F9QC33_9ZZZZ